MNVLKKNSHKGTWPGVGASARAEKQGTTELRMTVEAQSEHSYLNPECRSFLVWVLFMSLCVFLCKTPLLIAQITFLVTFFFLTANNNIPT